MDPTVMLDTGDASDNYIIGDAVVVADTINKMTPSEDVLYYNSEYVYSKNT